MAALRQRSAESNFKASRRIMKDLGNALGNLVACLSTLRLLPTFAHGGANRIVSISRPNSTIPSLLV